MSILNAYTLFQISYQHILLHRSPKLCAHHPGQEIQPNTMVGGEKSKKVAPTTRLKADIAPCHFESFKSLAKEVSHNQLRRIESSQSLDLILILSPFWGSQQKDYRLRLRKELADLLTSQETNSPEENHLEHNKLTDLKQPPTHLDWSVSLSHCPSQGGFALCKKEFRLGMDIEKKARVIPKLLLRVSNPLEACQAPPSYIWSAKEAAFKAISADYPGLLLSDINIGSWSTESLGAPMSFEAHVGTQSPHYLGLGLLYDRPPYVIAFFAISRSTLV
jgi:phosphopantetheinyl transferase (holo-ACP synthase)